MLPHRVSHACSTTGEATCSLHLLSDLLETGGGTEAVKLAASAMSSSDCFLPLFCFAEPPTLRARMSTCRDNQYRPATAASANGIFSQMQVLVSARWTYHCQINF